MLDNFHMCGIMLELKLKAVVNMHAKNESPRGPM